MNKLLLLLLTNEIKKHEINYLIIKNRDVCFILFKFNLQKCTYKDN